ncbi:transposase [Microcystis aeruginosa]|uniref:transposase n=1 Tax=Microcystis aeruginosa TaxID=1126 RepID=UPI003A0FBEE4
MSRTSPNPFTVACCLVSTSNLNYEQLITLVLDDARYQKCKIVEELALSLSIDLLYLPSYSPNLNLIERRWKLGASHICRNTDNQQLSVTLKLVQKYEQSRVSISHLS